MIKQHTAPTVGDARNILTNKSSKTKSENMLQMKRKELQISQAKKEWMRTKIQYELKWHSTVTLADLNQQRKSPTKRNDQLLNISLESNVKSMQCQPYITTSFTCLDIFQAPLIPAIRIKFEQKFHFTGPDQKNKTKKRRLISYFTTLVPITILAELPKHQDLFGMIFSANMIQE